MQPLCQPSHKLGNNRSARQSSLTRLPSNLDKLQSLRWLVLHENRLTEVPRTICDAASLEYINLKDNFLRDLPNCTDQLTSLFVFFFTDNFIDCEAFRAVQPESIGAMCRDDEQRRCNTAFADRAACVATPICHWNPRTSACQLEPYVVPDSSSDARDNASRRVVIAVVLGVLTAAVVAGVAAFLYERRRRGAPSPDGADTDRDLTEMLLDERTGLHTDAEDAGGDGVGAREPTYYGEPAQTNSWTVSPDLIDFDMQGNQVAVGTIVKQTLTITNTRFRSFTYKIYTPSRPSKFSVLAQPMEGEVKVGHTATVTVSAVLHCTTTLEQPVVVSVAYGHPRRQEYREVPEVLVGKLSTRIDYDDLVFREHIGDGCSGSVSKGEWRDNIVAIKTLRIITDETREEFVREVEIMEHIRCPFIVACLGAVITLDKLCLVTEFMPLGSLDTVMHAYAFSPAMKIRIAQDIANGMKFLHSSGILHRDLKPGNVLCNELQLDSAVVCKIADFGTSRAVSSSKSSAAMTRRIGTPLYMAPEVLSGNTEYTKIADVFSFAIMLTEIWNDREPYSECNIKSTWGLISHILDGNVCERFSLSLSFSLALRSWFVVVITFLLLYRDRNWTATAPRHCGRSSSAAGQPTPSSVRVSTRLLPSSRPLPRPSAATPAVPASLLSSRRSLPLRVHKTDCVFLLSLSLSLLSFRHHHHRHRRRLCLFLHFVVL